MSVTFSIFNMFLSLLVFETKVFIFFVSNLFTFFAL
jgi:hypothetical protein